MTVNQTGLVTGVTPGRPPSPCRPPWMPAPSPSRPRYGGVYGSAGRDLLIVAGDSQTVAAGVSCTGRTRRRSARWVGHPCPGPHGHVRRRVGRGQRHRGDRRDEHQRPRQGRLVDPGHLRWRQHARPRPSRGRASPGPVTFLATGVAGPAVQMAAGAGNNQSALEGTRSPFRPPSWDGSLRQSGRRRRGHLRRHIWRREHHRRVADDQRRRHRDRGSWTWDDPPARTR